MKKIILFALAFAIIFPQFAIAGTPGEDLWRGGFWGPILPSQCLTGTGCKSLCDVADTIQRLIYLGMSMLIYAIAPLMLVIGGIMILLAGASPDLISRGKKVLSGTVIGIVIALAAFMIVDQVFSAIAGLSGSGIDWRNIQCRNNLPSAGTQ